MSYLPQFLLVLCLASASICVAATRRKPAPAAPAPKAAAVDQTAAIRHAIDAEQQHVVDCVVKSAPSGRWSVTVRLQAKLNSAGQMLSLKLDVTPEPSDVEGKKTCIDQVLRNATYPKSAAPLTSIDREWTFSMQ